MGNCSSGAVGQLSGEIASILDGSLRFEDVADLNSDNRIANVNIARLAGAFGSAVAGGSAEDVSLGANLGGIAAENNNLLGIFAFFASAAAKGCSKIKTCSNKAAQQVGKVVSSLAKRPQANVDDLLQAGKQADRLGIDLNDISIENGIARTRIDLTDSLNPQDIENIQNALKARGANKVEVDTGFIANERLDNILRQRVQDGRVFAGGRVRFSDSPQSDFIIEFDLR